MHRLTSCQPSAVSNRLCGAAMSSILPEWSEATLRHAFPLSIFPSLHFRDGWSLTGDDSIRDRFVTIEQSACHIHEGR